MFAYFNKDEDAAWRINAGATAAFKDCTFHDNTAAADAAGPALGLRSAGDSDGSVEAPSYAWLRNTTCVEQTRCVPARPMHLCTFLACV